LSKSSTSFEEKLEEERKRGQRQEETTFCNEKNLPQKEVRPKIEKTCMSGWCSGIKGWGIAFAGGGVLWTREKTGLGKRNFFRKKGGTAPSSKESERA